MEDKVSVITVVYNDVEHIQETLESFFSQTWSNKEYIVIDGGSTDGTENIIRRYIDRITYFCSEKDNGIYDAMNKGILHSTGDWINILNSGDHYVSPTSLEEAMQLKDKKNIDVIYCNSIEVTNGDKMSIQAGEDVSLLRFFPIYRHGSSLVRAILHKKYLFDINQNSRLGFALDFNMIYHLYRDGYRFKKVDCFLEEYDREGASAHPFKSLWYNYKIVSDGKFMLGKTIVYAKLAIKYLLSRSLFYKYASAFVMEYVVNDILPHIPFWNIRKIILKFAKLHIGKKSFIMKRVYMMSVSKIKIGSFTDINRDCFLDGRGGIIIGNNVSISHGVKIVTGGHDYQTQHFNSIYKPVTIDDYAWLGIGCTILQGVRIGRGAVVCAGAVVTHDVKPYEVVGGIPARHIKNRNSDLDYHCIWNSPFT